MNKKCSMLTRTEFTYDCVLVLEYNFGNYDTSMAGLDELETFADDDFKKAFLQGCRDYVNSYMNIQYKPKLEYRLDKLTSTNVLIENSIVKHLNMLDGASMIWLRYNIVNNYCMFT